MNDSKRCPAELTPLAHALAKKAAALIGIPLKQFSSEVVERRARAVLKKHGLQVAPDGSVSRAPVEQEAHNYTTQRS